MEKAIIKTSNYVGENSKLLKYYPNRRKICIACSLPYFVSLKKVIGKSKYCSRKCSDKNQIKGFWNKGKKQTAEHRRKVGEYHRGEKSIFWKGGISSINILIRNGLEYRLWREKVFERDNYTCQECRQRGIYLQADHIKPFAYFPKLRFELSNGRTLCRECHKKTDTFAQRARNLYEIRN